MQVLSKKSCNYIFAFIKTYSTNLKSVPRKKYRLYIGDGETDMHNFRFKYRETEGVQDISLFKRYH
jgi:hypothetical protein